jgi:hypothetical protein
MHVLTLLLRSPLNGGVVKEGCQRERSRFGAIAWLFDARKRFNASSRTPLPPHEDHRRGSEA